MKLVYAVRDRAVDVFGQPIFCLAQGEALRSFMDEVNRPGSAINSHPEDYDLYLIGSFDETTGALRALEGAPKMVCVGKEVFKEAAPF